MVVNAEELKEELRQSSEVEGPVFKMARDPRITPVGRWLRRLSWTNSQLWNGLRGDMSWWVPAADAGRGAEIRPVAAPRLVADRRDHRQSADQRTRHEVGLRRVDADGCPVRRRRFFWMDVRLLARTVTAVLTPGGAS
jgi:lipopolysaccharide/colanic/teichoic acid biosynthesis glycosyltransferase